MGQTTTALSSSSSSSPRNAYRKFLRHAVVCMVLLIFTLASLVSFSRNMATTSTSSSSFKTKEARESHDAEVFYNNTWRPLRKCLCGEGAPNLMLSSTLFELARDEVFSKKTQRDHPGFRPVHESINLSKMTFRTDKGTPTQTLTFFFSGDFGSSVFYGTTRDGKPFVTIYARIWKCGNNQIRWMERKLFKHLNGTYAEIPLWKAVSQYVPELYTNRTAFPGVNLAKLPNPCIYTAVRDPIAHFLSGYNEVEVRQLGEYNNGSRSNDFKKGDKPAPYHTMVPYEPDAPDLRKKRFRAFVEDLLLEEPVFGSHYIYSHFFSMSRILVTLAKRQVLLTGYLPTLDNITTAWPSFVADTCPNAPALEDIPKMTKQGQHRSSKDRLGLYRAAKEVWHEGGPIARALCLLHAYDYACFKDLPEKIPALCRSVYQDHSSQLLKFGAKHYLKYWKRKDGFRGKRPGLARKSVHE